MIFSRIRGTNDLYDDKINEFNIVTEYLKTIARLFNFNEIQTPIFEQSELFTKSIGETSDIVHKEFYVFKDKSDRSIALRPEGTAGVIRAIVEDKLLLKNNFPLKFFYCGPMFRYERPQSGRQRQFHQFGVEVVGNFSIFDEVNLICFADSIITNFKIENIKLKINNIGSYESRSKWIEELRNYFKNYLDELTELSKERVNTNPLRILDDKIDGQKEIVKNAPKLEFFLTKKEKEYFQEIVNILDKLNLKYEIDYNLVRGLDYYTGLVFEFVSTSKELAGQSTIIGGGKYSNLVKQTGGIDCEGIGLAIGIERLIIAIKQENPHFFNKDNSLDIVFSPLTTNAQLVSQILANHLRYSGYSVDLLSNTCDLKKHFKFSEQNNAKYVCIIGEKELSHNKVLVKNQKTHEQVEVDIEQLPDYFHKVLNVLTGVENDQ